jgi:hypothetical protein
MSEMQNSNMISTIDGNQDQVVFENVPDQYVKGEDVTAHFTILHDITVNSNEDQIGLLRVSFILAGEYQINDFISGRFNEYSRMFSLCPGSI